MCYNPIALGFFLVRSRRFSFVSQTRLFLAIDLGGTKTAVSAWVVGADGEAPERLAKNRWDTLTHGPVANMELIVRQSRTLLAGLDRSAGDQLAAIGISAGGPVEAQKGTIRSIPNLPGWDNVAIAGQISAALGAPTFVENDANASVLAEWRYGAGRGSNDVSFLTCSTGIGAGVIVDGRLLRGHSNLAGEIGHLEIVRDGLPCGCGRRGCLEAYASGTGIARRLARVRDREGPIPKTARDLVDAAHGGDGFAMEFLRETARFLSMGLSHLIFCLNPERIILGTIAVGAGDLLLGPLRLFVSAGVWPSFDDGLSIVPAGLGDDLGDYAALAAALEADPAQ